MGKQSNQTSTVYGNTTTTNPYVTSTTNNSGTTSNFQQGTALDTVYNFVNNNIESLLQEYLNPTLNSTTNQAKLNAFNKELSSSSRAHLENNIINPLSNRNMIRSSQATDLYKNLAESNVSSLASYIDELLAESQNSTAEQMNNILQAYMQGYDVISDNQEQSLETSKGNATTYNNYDSSSGAISDSSEIAKGIGQIISLIVKAIGSSGNM